MDAGVQGEPHKITKEVGVQSELQKEIKSAEKVPAPHKKTHSAQTEEKKSSKTPGPFKWGQQKKMTPDVKSTPVNVLPPQEQPQSKSTRRGSGRKLGAEGPERRTQDLRKRSLCLRKSKSSWPWRDAPPSNWSNIK